MPRILLVDRSTPSSRRLGDVLERAGYDVCRAEAAEGALRLLREEPIQVVLGEAELSGGELLAEALRLPTGPPVILFEDFADVSQTFEAIRRGAFDTLARPISDEQVLHTVRRAIEHRALLAENRRLRGVLGECFELGNLVSRDPRMARVFEIIQAVADSRATLLLCGESGTGKTVLARAIHERSARVRGPFVTVHCGALPLALLESELFGHAKGAFTGALRDRAGKFETADGGTILLDEIGTAPRDLQVKLLRIVEEGSFERVGESHTRQVDVRVIAATNEDLRAAVADGTFRSDLYWRLEVVRIEIPPLRERPSDIPLLAQRFLARFARQHDRKVESFDPLAVQRLCAHPWPGNVRELEHTIERAVLLSKGSVLTARDLWADAGPSSPASDPTAPARSAVPELEDLPIGPLQQVLEVLERALLERALSHHAGRRGATASALGINRTTLFNKMRKYNLLAPKPDSQNPTDA